MLVTLLTIGIVAGLAGARDAVIDELGDIAQAVIAVDQSYSLDFPLVVVVYDPDNIGGATNSSFVDSASFVDCDRDDSVPGQEESDAPPGGPPGGNDAGGNGNNGLGNGDDPQPPGNPPPNDQNGAGPGAPGNGNGNGP
jgi:hypothetical protein